MSNYSFVCDSCGQRIGGIPNQYELHGIIWELCNACTGPKMALPTESAVGEVYREE